MFCLYFPRKKAKLYQQAGRRCGIEVAYGTGKSKIGEQIWGQFKLDKVVKSRKRGHCEEGRDETISLCRVLAKHEIALRSSQWHLF
jgi:hypothetical protein